MTVYFVTGATGVVGSAIVDHLLRHSDCRLRLLIRARSAEELAERLQKLLTYWECDEHDARARVSACAGDTSQPYLGLGEEAFGRLAHEVTHVVHSAGVVRMNLPLEDARAAAVGAARNMVALWQAGRAAGVLRKVEYISTVGVGGRMPGAVPERWIDTPRAFHNTYEQSKAEAEVEIRQAAQAGMPVTVHRPSMVVGDSATGRVISFQIFYHLAEFLSGRRTFGVFPDPGVTQLDVIPTDALARAIAWSSQTDATIGRILHLCSGPGRSPAIDQLRTRVRERFVQAGYRLPRALTVPPAFFRAAIPVVRVFSGERERRALSTLPIFLDYLAEAQAFSNDETIALLEHAGIDVPHPDAFLDVVIDRYLRERRR